ncbi:hypothetical protein C2G38_2193644 [Gigaspora rosea]|uniref:Uncharacterized protein n=1 Tax=Gigaspora rosea TaxID=44941 RepID=A0A397UYX6_9GLOM|nr:hypothetical protein C2G38_2193644 [Gigaspora rosea]
MTYIRDVRGPGEVLKNKNNIMLSSSAIPYDSIYDDTCDKLYSEPYDEFYNEPYDEPHNGSHNELYNNNTTQEPTNTTGSNEFGDNKSLT